MFLICQELTKTTLIRLHCNCRLVIIFNQNRRTNALGHLRAPAPNTPETHGLPRFWCSIELAFSVFGCFCELRCSFSVRCVVLACVCVTLAGLIRPPRIQPGTRQIKVCLVIIFIRLFIDQLHDVSYSSFDSMLFKSKI